MDEIEFRRRVYANPNEPDQETLDAASANPAFLQILQQTQVLEQGLNSALNDVAAPADLQAKLMAIADADQTNTVVTEITAKSSKVQNFFQYYAMAACLLLAVGVTFSLNLNTRSSSAELAFGDAILAHLYEDSEEINAISSGLFDDVVSIPVVNASMADTGIRLLNSESMRSVAIRSAKPCEILPAFYSAHLLVNGTQGAVSIIVINNSPVSAEYSIRDSRFNGIVIPMEGGNMILVGEKNENLDQYKALFTESVERII